MKGEKAYRMAVTMHRKMYEYPNRFTTEDKKRFYHEYFQLIRKSAYYGNTEAQYDLAQQYENMSFLGLPNPKYNPKKCIYWYTKACKKNHPEANNNLAALYEIGEGCEKNIELALALYKTSADLGSLNGKANYKIMLKDIAKGKYDIVIKSN